MSDKQFFTAMWNLPGCLPDTDSPSLVFESFADAAEYFADELDAMGNPFDIGDRFGDEFERMARELRAFAESDPRAVNWSDVHPDGYVYSVERVDLTAVERFDEEYYPLRSVNVDGFILRTWATDRVDRRGQTRIAYVLTSPDGAEIFAGEEFCGSPMDSDDSDDNLRSLLGFLTLRPGDTDAEYFADYTDAQRAFCDEHAESLSLWAVEPGDYEGEPVLEFVDLTDEEVDR